MKGQRLGSLGLVPTGVVTLVITASENREVRSPSQILGLVLSRAGSKHQGPLGCPASGFGPHPLGHRSQLLVPPGGTAHSTWRWSQSTFMMIKIRLRLPGLVPNKEGVFVWTESRGWVVDLSPVPPEGFIGLGRCPYAVQCLPSFLVTNDWWLSSWAPWRQCVLGIASGGDGCSMPSSATLAETSSEPPGFRGGQWLDQVHSGRRGRR